MNFLEKIDKAVDPYMSKIPVLGAHWRTTLCGYAVAGVVAAYSFAEVHDYREPKFWLLMLGAAVSAIKGRLQADAKKIAEGVVQDGK